MTKEKLDKVQVVVLCVVIAFFLMMSIKANAQTHTVDTVKYSYFDLQERPIKNSFFAEKNMGWRMWMLADDGIRKRKVFVDTIRK